MHDRSPHPDECRTLEQVSGGVAAIDAQLLALLSDRFAFMRAAARIGGAEVCDEDEARRSLIASVRRRAFEAGVPVGLAGDFWDRLFDASLAYKRQAAERLRKEA